MYFYLISSLKRRLILELQDSFSQNPPYEKIVPFIQNKFSFKERPQFGIVVKGSSANKVQFSADNFAGTVTSKVMLAYVEKPAYLLEWAKEDSATLRANGDMMETPPGVYIIECLSAPTTPGETGEFSIQPLITVTNETLLVVKSTVESEAQLLQVPMQGTLRLYENQRYMLVEGRDYTVNYQTGLVTLLYKLQRNSTITADYRYSMPPIGPFLWRWNTADYTTLRGVVLAFGKRGAPGDKVAVVVYEDRVDTANAFGGKFEASFDLDVIATDSIQMEEIADFSVMYLWGQKRATLSAEGLEIIDVTMGGEAEDVYDETGDLHYYQASLSVTVQGDWEIHVPLPFTMSRVTATTPAQEAQVGADRTGPATGGLQAVAQGLLFFTVPIIVGRNNSFERIS